MTFQMQIWWFEDYHQAWPWPGAECICLNVCETHEIPSEILYLQLHSQFACDFITICTCHDNVIKWKHFPHYWPFVWGIHQSPVNSPHKGQWRGALMFSLIFVWTNGWENNRDAGDLRCHCTHYDVTVMIASLFAPVTASAAKWLSVPYFRAVFLSAHSIAVIQQLPIHHNFAARHIHYMKTYPSHINRHMYHISRQ